MSTTSSISPASDGQLSLVTVNFRLCHPPSRIISVEFLFILLTFVLLKKIVFIVIITVFFFLQITRKYSCYLFFAVKFQFHHSQHNISANKNKIYDLLKFIKNKIIQNKKFQFFHESKFKKKFFFTLKQLRKLIF